MSQLLFILVIALFIAMLFVNVYFRMKVMKTYKKLVQNRVEFSVSHVFNKAKMREEVLPRYPKSAPDIELFVAQMQYSIKMALLLIVLISLCGAVLLYF